MSEGAKPETIILLVEDNAGDVDLVLEAVEHFETPHKLHIASDGSQALEYLAACLDGEKDRLPDLVLLDLNVPKTDGREVLAAIKNDDRMKHVPVIVLTSSAAERELLQVYRLHANCFITKPTDIDTFFAMFQSLERFWLRFARLPPPCGGHAHHAEHRPPRPGVGQRDIEGGIQV